MLGDGEVPTPISHTLIIVTTNNTGDYYLQLLLSYYQVMMSEKFAASDEAISHGDRE